MRDYKQEINRYLDDTWDRSKGNRRDLLEKLRSSKHICLFGAGQVGQAVAYDLAEVGITVDYFCDNSNKLWGKNVNQSVKCISPQELEKYKSDAFVLVTTGYCKEVCAQLRSLNFNNIMVIPQLMVRNNAYWDSVECSFVKDKIGCLTDILDDEKSKEIAEVVARNWFNASGGQYMFSKVATGDQYFPHDLIELSDKESFVDAGAFDGDTVRDFLSRVDNHFKEIFAYELEENYHERMMCNMQDYGSDLRERIHLYNLGLYSDNKAVRYIPNSTSSVINSAADGKGEVVRLSDHLYDKKITFIKMDIEGAEVEALLGAEEIIKASKPKLAICVYHAPSNLWEIPIYIKMLVPEYKIYLRHHTNMEYETVCYAVI